MSQRAPTQGFTLLEMLVTLAVIGLVVSILWSALFQIAQIERRLDGTQFRHSSALVRVEWLRAALGGLVAGEGTGTERFVGNAGEMTGWSTAMPRFPGVALDALRLSLQFNEASGQTQLLLHEKAGDALQSDTVRPLLSWSGQDGRFRYQDARGAWQDAWPPSQPDAPPLPTLIVIETGLENPRVIAVSPQGSLPELPSRKVLEQL